MAKMSVEEILKRWKKADAHKEHWRDIYSEAYEYALPNRNLYDHYDTSSPGSNKRERLYDSTAENSTKKFANKLQSTLFPPYRNWCRLEPGTRFPAESRPQIQQVLDLYLEEMFNVFKQSNFDLALGEFFLDLAVGTGVMCIEKGGPLEPIRFTAVPPFLCSFEEGPHNTIENVYLRIRMRPELIQRQYPEAKLDAKLEELIRDKPEEKVGLLEATIYDPVKGEYCFHVIFPDTQHLLLVRYHNTSPWVVARFTKAPGEILGRGPMLSALADAKSLNKAKEFLLKNASLAIAPIFTARDDGVLNPETISIAPGSVIPVASNGGPQGPSLTPLGRGGDVQLSQLVLADLQQSIKKELLDEGLPRDDMSARTALEISSRLSDLAQNLGAAFGRLTAELMVPIVRRTMSVMDELGLIELPIIIDGLTIKVVPVSPLAQAQNKDEIQNVLQAFQIAQGLGPEGQMAFRTESVVDFVARKLGVPTELMTTPEERMQMQMMAAQAAAQQQQAMGEQENAPT